VIAVCLLVSGVVAASIPASVFTLGWRHSIEKTRWEERYRVEHGNLVLVQARIEALGAGMEPPTDARLIDGWWTWKPSLAPLPELRITRSDFTQDYDLCWNGRCSALQALVGPAPKGGDVVTVRPCPR